ncbi:sulfite exporter TauE/SafE [Sphingobium sp. B1D7B]|uniref:sulfite exporter TauE/SafE family protein n=1 Tax=unclassified Sphingobium TaxID=2611147 RepID=UPI00222420A5|nr:MULTISPECIES: sulfite exporter TauE/SafE family protein [unclassified Sphingobium]MCW2390436.1 sulfite exporter TauE/SafE [Sphingobium sp. B11D3A]MCW2405577.1 sulfite exporter TauE/SafE [Sphingobium sp. B1D7B]
MADPWTFGGGFLLGFASSLHCVGMCGGIALLLGQARAEGDHPAVFAARLHAGRIGAYMVMGGAAGALGALALGGLDATLGHLLLRWAAAMSLAWVGFSMLGLMPSPAVVGHAIRGQVHVPASVAGAARSMLPPRLRMIATGFGWGMMPCGMVYGALLYAAFAGSLTGGLLVMAGFGIGTLPALLAVQGGATMLAGLARKPGVRTLAALAILLCALLSLGAGEAGLLALCRAK